MLSDNAITPHLALCISNSTLHRCYQRGVTSSLMSILSGGAAFLRSYTIYYVKRQQPGWQYRQAPDPRYQGVL
jgi:hypothetical protein